MPKFSRKKPPSMKKIKTNPREPFSKGKPRRRKGSLYETFVRQAGERRVSLANIGEAYKKMGLTKKQALVIEIDRLQIRRLRMLIGGKRAPSVTEVEQRAERNIKGWYGLST